MRISPVLCILCAVSLTSCGPTSEPQAKRGEVATTSTDSSPPSESTAPSNTGDRSGAAIEQPVDATAEGDLQLEKLVFTPPEGWQRKQAASTFVLAEFALPKAEGDDADGRLTVSVAGGSVEANISRWRDQFGGKPDPAKEDSKEVNGLKITLVDFGGEFSDQRGPFAPATKRDAYRMLGAIIPVDGELHFVKAVGPTATMAAHADRFQQFIDSVKKK